MHSSLTSPLFNVVTEKDFDIVFVIFNIDKKGGGKGEFELHAMHAKLYVCALSTKCFARILAVQVITCASVI